MKLMIPQGRVEPPTIRCVSTSPEMNRILEDKHTIPVRLKQLQPDAINQLDDRGMECFRSGCPNRNVRYFCLIIIYIDVDRRMLLIGPEGSPLGDDFRALTEQTIYTFDLNSSFLELLLNTHELVQIVSCDG